MFQERGRVRVQFKDISKDLDAIGKVKFNKVKTDFSNKEKGI